MQATKIKVTEIPTEYLLDDSCALDEPWQFNCSHPSTHVEDTSYTYPGHDGEPIEVTGDIIVCDTCDEQLEEW